MPAAFEFTIPRGWQLNSNKALHYRQKAERVAALREQARQAGAAWLATHQPPTPPTHLIVTVIPATRRRTDPPNWWPTVKPLIDGLVDAGLLEDDSSEFIWRTSFQRGSHDERDTGGALKIVLNFTD